MNTPTTEEVNALIERLMKCQYVGPTDLIHALTALRDGNARLKPAWVPISERKPTKEDADDYGYLVVIDRSTGKRTSAGVESLFMQQEMASHFWPIPPLPSPPESAAEKQAREDYAAMLEATKEFSESPPPLTAEEFYWRKALAHARKERAT